jgi:pyruvate formate-lyase activating enzyme-like uncharacterized protein
MGRRPKGSGPIDPGSLPEALREIYDAARRPREPSTLDALRPDWADHVRRAREEVPDLYVEGAGEVLVLGEPSPGCRACHAGTWDCIFTTMRCNLDCAFCYSPHAIPRDYSGSLLGRTPEEITTHHGRTTITGISFSGGEPFLDLKGLFHWVGWFTAHDPDKYTWVYTNGLLATEEALQQLAALGVDEVRFDVAATGYDHPLVMEHVAAAARLLPRVTIEIPAIPEHEDRLLPCLERWAKLGVRCLNLHELMYEPGSNSWGFPGARREVVTADGHRTAIHPHSRALTLSVMRRVAQERLPMSVLDCSLQTKLWQLRGRRRCLAPLVQAPYERLVDDEVYESYRAYLGEQVLSFHPDELPEMRGRYPDHRFVRLVRTAPLSLADPGQWIAFEPLAAAGEELPQSGRTKGDGSGMPTAGP